MQPRFVDSQNFAQGFGFASRKSIIKARECQTTYQVGFCQGCDTTMDKIHSLVLNISTGADDIQSQILMVFNHGY